LRNKNTKAPESIIHLYRLHIGTFWKLLLMTSSRRLEVCLLSLRGYEEKQQLKNTLMRMNSQEEICLPIFDDRTLKTYIGKAILASPYSSCDIVMAGYESMQRLLHLQPVEYLGAVMVASSYAMVKDTTGIRIQL
jgi:hypothetical protein